MRRRDVLKLSAGVAMLAAPHVARAQRDRTLKFVPGGDLSLLDPVFTQRTGHAQPRLYRVRYALWSGREVDRPPANG